MTASQVYFGVAVALGFFLVTVYLTRKRLLSERIMILWIGIALCQLCTVLFPGLIARPARWLGFQMTSNAILSLATLFLLAFNLALTVKLSVMDQHLRRLTQELALRPLARETPEDAPPADEASLPE